MDLKAFTQKRKKRQVPETLAAPGTIEVTAQQLEWMLELHSEEWKEAEAIARGQDKNTEERRKALDKLVEIWSERAERYLVMKTGRMWHRRFRQRGRVQPIRTETMTPQITKTMEGKLETEEYMYANIRMTNLQRRVGACEKMSMGSQLVKTWTNVRRELIREVARTRRRYLHVSKNLPIGGEWTETSGTRT